MSSMKILLTGSDFPPKIGGLAVYSATILEILKQMGHCVVVLSWSTASLRNLNIEQHKLLNEVDWIINTQVMFCHFILNYAQKYSHKSINFIHGSELCFSSPHFLKALYKKLFKQKILNTVEKSFYNIFNSQFTLSKIKEHGLSVDYSRDLVFYPPLLENNNVPCEEIPESIFSNKFEEMKNEGVKLIWISRDAPHKDFDSVIHFCRELSKHAKKQCTLYLSAVFKNKTKHLADIKFLYIDQDLPSESAYKKAHFNLIFSKDLSRKGFFEGFGLTALEAGIFGTPTIATNSGGQREAVHDQFTGWVLEDLASDVLTSWWQALTPDSYIKISQNVRSHTQKDHNYHSLINLFSTLLKSNKESRHEACRIAV